MSSHYTVNQSGKKEEPKSNEDSKKHHKKHHKNHKKTKKICEIKKIETYSNESESSKNH